MSRTNFYNPGQPVLAPAVDLDLWMDEGATGAPSRAATSRKTPKEARDTAAGCRDRAAADLLQSVSMLVANERRRMEVSAASWTVRAELLDRIETSFAARQAAAGRTVEGEQVIPRS